MTTTPGWLLTQLESGQQGVELFNEALRVLEGAAAWPVVDRDLRAAPASPTAGTIYLVAATPSGGDPWETRAGYLALSIDGTQTNWAFRQPVEGDRLAIRDENIFLLFNGSAYARETQLRIDADSIDNPTTSVDRTLFFTENPITIAQMNAVVRGTTPSVTWTVRHSTDRDAAGNEVVTGGTVTTSINAGSRVTTFNDATIPASSWVWPEITAVSGTVAEFAYSILHRKDTDW